MELAATQVTSIDSADKILTYLAKHGASETPDIAFGLGIAPKEVAQSIYELRELNFVTTLKITSGGSGSEITRHDLLSAADRLTPVMVGKKEKKESQRRFLATGHPRVTTGKKNGQKHIHGVVGKHDLNKIPKGMKGKIYVALARPNMDAKAIAAAAGLQIKQTWNVLTDLTKLGYIAYTMKKPPNARKSVRAYHRLIDIKDESITSPDDIGVRTWTKKKTPQDDAEPPAPSPEEMKPSAVMPKSMDAIKKYADKELAEQFETLDGITIDALLEKLDANDVLLAAAVKIAEENEKLRALLKLQL